MTARANTDDFLTLFLNDTPMMDVRAPVEYEKGAFPCATNIPLLDNEQRAIIGTQYKQHGQDSAIELGWTLATPAIRQQRARDWLEFTNKHPNGYLYCFRGGLRSRLSQQLIADAGINYPIITGGYKALRRFLIEQMESHCQQRPFILISGRTGSGKTLTIHKIKRSIDLEGLANHRGSAFGRQVTAQPAQIDFENALSIKLLKLRHAGSDTNSAPIFTEDEGHLIGRINMPLAMRDAMQDSPYATLETPIEERVNIVLDDYVINSYPDYIDTFGEELGRVNFRKQILENLARIRKRLGGDRYQIMAGEFDEALDLLESTGNPEGFKSGIKVLLSDYYDPMYDYQHQQKTGRELFQGPRDELIEWANHYTNTP